MPRTFRDNINSTVTNIKDRYFRDAPPDIEKLNYPDPGPRVASRGMLIPYLGDGKKIPLDRSVIFQFNPEEIEYEKMSEFSHHDRLGFSYTIPFWVSGGSKTISFRLFLDATPGSNYRIFKKAISSKYQTNANNGTHINFDDYLLSGLADGSEGLLPELEKLEAFQYPIDKSKQDLVQFNTRRQVSGTTQSFTPANPDVLSLEQFANPPYVVFSYGNVYAVTLVQSMRRKDILFNKDLNPIRSEIDLLLEVHESRVIDTNVIFQTKVEVEKQRNDT